MADSVHRAATGRIERPTNRRCPSQPVPASAGEFRRVRALIAQPHRQRPAISVVCADDPHANTIDDPDEHGG